MDLDKYVRFIGSDDALMQEVREAFEWFASTPEGEECLEESLRIHEWPLFVTVKTDVFTNNCYIPPHHIYINPQQAQTQQIITESGDPTAFGLKRAVAHECFHARQGISQRDFKSFIDKERKIAARIGNAFTMEFLNNIAREIDTIVTPDDLLATYKRMYEDLSQRLPEIMQDFVAQAERNRKFMRFIERYEVPAVDFENHMMTKYQAGPARDRNYLRSAYNPETELLTMLREGIDRLSSSEISTEEKEAMVAQVKKDCAEAFAEARASHSENTWRGRISGAASRLSSHNR